MKHGWNKNVASRREPTAKKKSAPNGSGRVEKHLDQLVAIVVVIVVIPIAIGVPAVAVFIPPTMPLIPAAFARLVQIVARTISLPAVPAVMLHSFVESVVRPGDTPLASIVALGGCPGRCGECQHANKCHSSKHRPSDGPFLSGVKRHDSSILQSIPDWDGVLSYRTLSRRECSKSQAIP
jgi:hypothetical protein